MEEQNDSDRVNLIVGALLLSLAVLGAGCVPTTDKTPQTETPSTSSSDLNEKLDLSDSDLTHVSQDVFKQVNLVELDLSGNHLTGSLPAEIRFLGKLEVLDLSDNAMTGLPAEIDQLKKLKSLDVSNNQLTGLPLELGQLTALETLDLRGNQYSTYDLDLIRKNLPNTQILVD